MIRAAEARGIRLGALGTLKGLICGWEQGKLTVSQTYRDLLATVYGTTPEALGLAEVWSRNFPIVTWEEIRRGGEGTREARECAPGNPRKTRFPAPDGRSLPLSRQPEEEPRELLTVEAAARRLSVSRTTMFRLLKSGDVASVRIGHARRVPAEAITAYVKRLAAEQHAA
ncbi:helix-turn-helix domain-containing protein [Saccharopolyspora spinosa]|uniref:helix-turn-helix domain-containing protein n=1 Tax=Saccharopolyspora spinosa TaxID=60894 RepID=UPI0002378A2D|nr:helix-turn-helix domain-containing protein [Saccharopolyspora spinosa]